MSEFWHFTDAAGAQVGPVSAADVRDALRTGRATSTSLAWREGMAGWLPISQLGTELGLSDPYGIPPPPAPVPPQAPASPEPMPMYADDRRGMGGSEPNPYRAPAASVEMGVDSTDIVPAGFWRRFAASVIDSVVLVIPVLILAVTAGVSMSTGDMLQTYQSVGFQVVYYAGMLLVRMLYFAGMHSSANQATLGKMALGIKVTDEQGHRLSFVHALGRWFATALSYITLYIGFLMAAFTDRKRALHDMVAGTQVVDKWAYTASPERQKRGLSGCLIVFVVVMIVSPFLLAILAAIGISQYQDYVKRSQQLQGWLRHPSTPHHVIGAMPSPGRDWPAHYDWT